MLNTIDLFAGCGGLTEGFKASKNFRLLAAVEWEKDAVDTLCHRLKTKYKYSDANDICILFDLQKTSELFSGKPVKGFPPHMGLDKAVGGERVDVIIGGPPCQAYSVAGRIRDAKGMHDDYRNYLFESYIKVVEHFQPTACIFENVPGMLSAYPGGISIIERIKLAFDNAGYVISSNLKEEATLDLSDFGVPQNRTRVIIVAIRKKSFKDPESKISQFYSQLSKKKVKDKKTVSEALSGLPKILPLEKPEKRVSHFVELKNKNKLISDHLPRFHNQRDIEIFRLLAKDIESNKLVYSSAESLKELYTTMTGKSSEVHKYHVLRLDKPSNTIPAHLYKDGLRHIHPDSKQARSITIREAARLQTFPDNYEFLGSSGSKYKMIGNAVPPLFAKKVAQALYEVL